VATGTNGRLDLRVKPRRKLFDRRFRNRQDDGPAWRIVGVRQASPNAASGLVQGSRIGLPIPAANFLEFVGQAAQHRAADAEEAVAARQN
jgi:hypothetical protein